MGRSPEKKTMAVPNKPITPKVVHDLLREKVLKGFVVAPKANDPLVKYLAQISEDIRSEARAHHGLGKEQQKRVATIREALYVRPRLRCRCFRLAKVRFIIRLQSALSLASRLRPLMTASLTCAGVRARMDSRSVYRISRSASPSLKYPKRSASS